MGRSFCTFIFINIKWRYILLIQLKLFILNFLNNFNKKIKIEYLFRIIINKI